MKPSNGTSTPQGVQFCQIILKSIINIEVMVRTYPDGLRHAGTNAPTHVSVVVVFMSCLLQAGSTKNSGFNSSQTSPGFNESALQVF